MLIKFLFSGKVRSKQLVYPAHGLVGGVFALQPVLVIATISKRLSLHLADAEGVLVVVVAHNCHRRLQALLLVCN